MLSIEEQFMSTENMQSKVDKTVYCQFVGSDHIQCCFSVTPNRAKWSKAKYGKILCIKHSEELEKSKGGDLNG